jgi:phage antirepressor YoqD-like protein
MDKQAEQTQQQTEQTQQQAEQTLKQQPKLVDIEVVDEIVALNLLVSFVNLAQRRGVFTLDESAKIWECIKKFQKK